MTQFSLFGWLAALARRSGRTARPRRPKDLCRRQPFVPRLEALEDRLTPSTLTVTSAADDGSPGTLRATIAAAASGDTIQFASQLNGQTIALVSGQLAINKDLDIEGPGAANLTVSGNNASRVFDIAAGTTVTIAGLTIADGRVLHDGGGGVLNESASTLTLRNDTLLNNQALGIGGGLWNQGEVLVVGSAFVGNQALGDNGVGEGGGIDNDGIATVMNSTFTNNRAVGATAGVFDVSGDGGGIAADGPLTVRDSIFTGNQALGGPVISASTVFSQGLGGAIVSFAAPTVISGSTFIGNEAIGGAGSTSLHSLRSIGVGGGVLVFNPVAALDPTPVMITGSTFSHNRAIGGAGGAGHPGSNALGGGLAIEFRTTLTLEDSSFDHNVAMGGAGGDGAAGGAGIGGGIDISFDRGAPIPVKATLTHVTLSHNQALGGLGGSGATGGNGWGGGLSVGSGFLFVGSDAPSGRPDTTVVRLSDSVLSNNLALGGDGATGGNGFGGGVLVGRGASLSVSTSTITSNHANGGSGTGGGSDGQGVGGGVYDLGTFAFDVFTVIARNHASTSNDDLFP